MATASIQVVACDPILDLYPRTLVHLFYLDSTDTREVGDLTKDEHDQKEMEKVADLEAYLADERYKLLFAGEMFSVQYSQTHASRSAVIQCQDFSSYWSSARALFVAGKGTSSKTKAMAFSSGAVLRYDKLNRKPYEVLLNLLLKKKSIQHPDVQGLMGGVLLLLEYLGGVYKGKDKFRGINDFFSQASLRLHLSRMVGTAKEDNTSKLLLGTKGFRKMFRRSLSSMGNQVSFEDVIGMVLSQLQSYKSPVLAPRYRRKDHLAYDVKKSKKTSVSIGDAATDRLAQLEAIRTFAARADANYNAMNAQEGMNTMQGGVIKKGNPLADFESTHIFGKDLARFAAAANECYAAQDVSAETDIAGTSPITAEMLADPKIGPAANLDKAAVALAGSMVAARKVPGRWGGQEFPGINMANLSSFRTKAAKAAKAYAKAQVKYSTVTETVTGATEPWLYTHILTPELFLCAPPKCNVLFPDHVGQMQMSKEWYKEITRLHLTTRKEWQPQKSAFQRQQYISPAIDTAHKTSAMDQFEKGRSFLLPHEIFSGIIAKYDQVAKIPAYKKLAKAQAAEAGEEYQLDKVDYLQRIANFLFIKYRIGPRTMTISGRFNPAPVVGMSTMAFANTPDDSVVRKAVYGEDLAGIFESETLDAGVDEVRYNEPQALFDDFAAALDIWKNSKEISPKVYCGLMHSLVHNVSQEGGQTRYTLTHLWDPYNEEVPGMGNFEVKVPGQTTTKKTVLPDYPLAGLMLDGEKAAATGSSIVVAADPGATGSILKPGPTLTDAVVTSTENAAAYMFTGAYKHVIKPKLDSKGNATKWTGPKGGTVKSVDITDPTELGVAIAEGDPALGAGTWGIQSGRGTVTITETYTPYKRKKLGDIPFEYAVRPPWLGGSYANSQIGAKLYLPLLGCTSICDEYKKMETKFVVNAIQQLRLTDADSGDTATSDEQLPVIQNLVQDFVTGHTMARAADGVLRAYLQHKHLARQGSTGQFITSFTSRKYASVNDIIGSSDLVFNEDTGAVLEGREGFHSRAFGDRTEYVLLDHPKLLQYGDVGAERKLDPQTDPRKTRYLVVSRYMEHLARLSASATKTKKLG